MLSNTESGLRQKSKKENQINSRSVFLYKREDFAIRLNKFDFPFFFFLVVEDTTLLFFFYFVFLPFFLFFFYSPLQEKFGQGKTGLNSIWLPTFNRLRIHQGMDGDGQMEAGRERERERERERDVSYGQGRGWKRQRD